MNGTLRSRHRVSRSNVPIFELFKKRYGMLAGNIIGTGTYKPDNTPAERETGQSTNITPFWMIGGAGVEVQVDTETGQVRILKLVNIIDCGTLINPRIAETADLRCGAHATRFHDVQKDASRLRLGHECFARGLQDSEFLRHTGGDRERGGRRLSAQRSFRRQRSRKIRDAVRVAGGRERYRRCGRREADGIAAHPAHDRSR
jgi:hypothetical protein